MGRSSRSLRVELSSYLPAYSRKLSSPHRSKPAISRQSLFSRRLVFGLGVAQILSWGALIYAIAVLGAPMGVDLGVSNTIVFGAFSFSLVISGLAGPGVGKLIDRIGGRKILTLGSLLAAVSLAALALAPTVFTFVLAWGAAGVARAMTLYEAAFATLSQHTGKSFRSSVTAITLLGGLAGTVFLPLSFLGLEHFGWRATVIGFAAAEILICLPLHLWCIPPGTGARDISGDALAPGAELPLGNASSFAFVALATSFALSAFITSAISVHVVNLLQAAGLGIASAVLVSSLIGPMQVVGRLVEFAFGRKHSPIIIGAATLVLLAFSLIALLLVNGHLLLALLFGVSYGWANGVQTIMRGTIPAELFGHRGYGHLMGRLAAPSFIARAVAPVGLTLAALPGLRFDLAVPLLIAAAFLALVTYVIAIQRILRRRST